MKKQGREQDITNEELATLIRAGVDVSENMLQLWEQNRGFVRGMIRKLGGGEQVEDLEQESFLALYAAIFGYDPDRGVKFLTYAEYHIRNAINSYRWKNTSGARIPAHCMADVRKVERFRNAYRLQHGEEPPDALICNQTGINRETLEQVKRATQARIVSLDQLISGADGGEDTTLGDLLPSDKDMEADACERIQQEQLQAVIWPLVDSLGEDQADVIRRKYQEGQTLEEIAAECGSSPTSVKNTERRAMYRLRRPANVKKLQPFLPEALEAIAYRGCGVESFNRTWTSSTERAALRLP